MSRGARAQDKDRRRLAHGWQTPGDVAHSDDGFLPPVATVDIPTHAFARSGNLAGCLTWSAPTTPITCECMHRENKPT